MIANSHVSLLVVLATLFVCALPVAADEITLESVPPVVVKSFPEAGADGVDPAMTEIKVVFSKVMMTDSFSWSTASKDSFPETTGKPSYQDDKRTCVLPVHFKPGTTYAIWLNSNNFHNFQDASGTPAVPYLLVFKTK